MGLFTRFHEECATTKHQIIVSCWETQVYIGGSPLQFGQPLEKGWLDLLYVILLLQSPSVGWLFRTLSYPSCVASSCGWSVSIKQVLTMVNDQQLWWLVLNISLSSQLKLLLFVVNDHLQSLTQFWPWWIIHYYHLALTLYIATNRSFPTIAKHWSLTSIFDLLLSTDNS